MTRTRSLFALARRGPFVANVSGAVAFQGALFVSGTLSARLLGPEGRGYFALLTAWPSALCQVGAVGISLAATYFLAAGQVTGRDLLTVLRRPAGVQVLAVTTLNAAVIMGYVAITDAPIVAAALISLLQVPTLLAIDYGNALLLGVRQYASANTLRTVPGILYAAGIALLFATGVDSLTAVVAVLVGAGVVGAAVCAVIGVRAALSVREAADTRHRSLESLKRDLLTFGRQGYVGYLSPLDSFRIDQLVVGFLLSPRSLGIYAVAGAFTSFGRLVALNVGLTATPEVAREAGPRQQLETMKRTLLVAGAMLGAINAVLCIAVIPLIPALFGTGFHEAVPIAQVLLAASWLLSMKRVTVDLMRGMGSPQVGTQAEVVSLFVFASLCAPLGLSLGPIGVAIALGLAAAAGAGLLLARVRREIPAPAAV